MKEMSLRDKPEVKPQKEKLLKDKLLKDKLRKKNS